MPLQKHDPFAELHAVAPEHKAVDIALLNWALWVVGSPAGAKRCPMFVLFRQTNARGTYGAPTAPVPVSTDKAVMVEHAVRALPPFAAGMLRGWYVHSMPPHRLCRVLGIRYDEAIHELHRARTMLRNGLALEHGRRWEM